MLKIKEELNYRRGRAHSHCSECNHYVEIWISGIENEDRATQGRCQRDPEYWTALRRARGITAEAVAE